MGYCARMTRIKAVVGRERRFQGVSFARENDYSRLGSGSVKRAGKRDGLKIPFEQKNDQIQKSIQEGSVQPVPSATFPSKVIGTRITLETWRRAATLKPPDSPLRGLGGSWTVFRGHKASRQPCIRIGLPRLAAARGSPKGKTGFD